MGHCEQLMEIVPTAHGVLTEFDIDTGAEVSVISETLHQKISSPFLSPPAKRLRGPSNYSLPVTGCFTKVKTIQEVPIPRNVLQVSWHGESVR